MPKENIIKTLALQLFEIYNFRDTYNTLSIVYRCTYNNNFLKISNLDNKKL